MFFELSFQYTLEMLFRLILAGILGGLIGYERETENKPAGFRTNTLVCIGSALVMVTSDYIFNQYADLTNMDPARLGAQVISGIGFIGAGTIIRDGMHVRGLTTAAGLWVVACIGLATGIGFYTGAIACTIFIYLILFTMKRIQEKIHYKNHDKATAIKTVDRPGQLGAIGSVCGSYDISISNVEFTISDESDNLITITIFTHIPANVSYMEFMLQLQRLEGIKRVYEVKSKHS